MKILEMIQSKKESKFSEIKRMKKFNKERRKKQRRVYVNHQNMRYNYMYRTDHTISIFTHMWLERELFSY